MSNRTTQILLGSVLVLVLFISVGVFFQIFTTSSLVTLTGRLTETVKSLAEKFEQPERAVSEPKIKPLEDISYCDDLTRVAFDVREYELSQENPFSFYLEKGYLFEDICRDRETNLIGAIAFTGYLGQCLGVCDRDVAILYDSASKDFQGTVILEPLGLVREGPGRPGCYIDRALPGSLSRLQGRVLFTCVSGEARADYDWYEFDLLTPELRKVQSVTRATYSLKESKETFHPDVLGEFIRKESSDFQFE